MRETRCFSLPFPLPAPQRYPSRTPTFFPLSSSSARLFRSPRIPSFSRSRAATPGIPFCPGRRNGQVERTPCPPLRFIYERVYKIAAADCFDFSALCTGPREIARLAARLGGRREINKYPSRIFAEKQFVERAIRKVSVRWSN